MSTAVLIFTMVLSSVLQALLPPWPITQAKAPVLLALVVYYALTRSRGQAFSAAILAGFLQDANTVMPLGYSSIAFLLAAAVINRFRDEMYILHPITHIMCGGLAAGAALLTQALMLVFLLPDPYFVLGWQTVLLRVVGTAILGAIATPAMFFVMRGLDRYLGYVSQPETMSWP